MVSNDIMNSTTYLGCSSATILGLILQKKKKKLWEMMTFFQIFDNYWYIAFQKQMYKLMLQPAMYQIACSLLCRLCILVFFKYFSSLRDDK